MADSGPDVLSLREQEAELVMKENISVELGHAARISLNETFRSVIR